MLDRLISIEVITAFSAMIVWAAVALAYWPLVRQSSGFLKALFLCVTIVAAAIIARSLYWDITQAVLPRPVWEGLRDFFGAQKASSFFNLIFTLGGGFALYARVLLMPDEDRRRWHWYSVWLTFWRRK